MIARVIRPLTASCALLLVACAAPPAPPAEPPAAAPSLAVPPAPTLRGRAPSRAQKPPPIPVRALNVAADCRFRDETGYNGALKLAIEDARVRSFEASVNIPRRGTCRFDLKGFRQTRELPAVELSQPGGECVVRVWEQGDRVTVAFTQCRKMCSGEAWDYLWPILADRRDGSCA